jgi:hypothetical protein
MRDDMVPRASIANAAALTAELDARVPEFEKNFKADFKAFRRRVATLWAPAVWCLLCFVTDVFPSLPIDSVSSLSPLNHTCFAVLTAGCFAFLTAGCAAQCSDSWLCCSMF